uniref:transposase n=1 Tax=Teretinema zuelzerae TaxID=156 RepID=UPI002E7B6784|nr:transposase [Teretinema zuelzerae]
MPSEKAVRARLRYFGAKSNDRYPMIYRSRSTRWKDLNEFFNYPPEIRKAIYTTNAIKSLNFQLRKVTKN